MKSFFAELQRRHVYKVGAAYAVAGWLLVQIVTQVFPIFEVSSLAQRIIVLVIVAGFPVALVLAWLFDITAHGIVRTGELPPTGEAPEVRRERLGSDRKLNYVLGALLLLAIAYFVADHFGLMGGSRKTSIASTAINARSIAVLPFENLSEDKANGYFATGIQDEILTRIAKIGALKVISRVSTQQYPSRPDNLSEIAHQLGVANILEGSVQRAGDQVHINAQLIRAATDEHLWAESYDRKLENIFGVEAEVATAVAEALRAKLTGAEQQALAKKPTNNPDAYDAYLRGIALYRLPSDARLKALKSFEEAVRLDPNFAAAWAQLARTDSLWYFGFDQTPALRAAAQTSLETALRLQPDLDEVQLAQAFFQYWVLRDYEGARRSFEQLRTKLPNNADIPEALGFITRRLGRWDESRDHTDEAIALNPRDRLLWLEAAQMRHATRDFAAALRYYDQALNIWPDDVVFIAGKADVYQALGQLDRADALLEGLRPTGENPNGLWTICNQAVLRRRYPEAIRLLRNCLEQGVPSVGHNDFYYRKFLGDLQRLSGDMVAAKATYSQARDKLEQTLREQPENADWISNALAQIYSGLGDRELALKYAERAVSLTPASKDATVAPDYEETRARVAARFGQMDVAISILERLLKIPYFGPVTPALLRLDPDFDPLRGDPRFEKLAHSGGK